MSTAELKVVQGGKKTLRLVEAFRHQNSSAWEVADALQEDVNERLPDEARARALAGEPGVNSGLTEALIDVLAEARSEGVDLAPEPASRYYRTSVAWPLADRYQDASYRVHERLYAKPNRKELLGKWLTKYEKVTSEDVDRLLSEQKPQRTLSFLDGIEDGVRRLLISRGKPWGAVQQGDRDDIARRLRQIAQEIQHGEGKFGAQ